MTRVGWIRLGVIAAAVALLEAACRLGLIDRRVRDPAVRHGGGALSAARLRQLNDMMARTFGIVILAVALAVVLGFALASSFTRCRACAPRSIRSSPPITRCRSSSSIR